jgi:ABC-type lipoprotein release transport system permease subunit
VKTLKLLQLAMTYLFRYRRRYFFLFLALVFGFSIVTVITSVKDGMYENVYQAAQSHYAGDLVTLGYDKRFTQWNHLGKNDVIRIFKAAEDTGLNPSRVVLRTNFPDKGIVYYNGAALKLKYVIGIDWDAEEPYFKNLTYASPPLEPLAGDEGMVLSGPVARKLGIRRGDSLILEAETKTGQKNTGNFVVQAIVEDSTIFGYYKAYISRRVLNRLLDFNEDECSNIGFYFNERHNLEEKKALFQQQLEKQVNVGPLVKTRAELDRETSLSWDGVRVFALTIPVYLSEVADLLGAMNILTYFLYIMMLLIILVSASVTYRLILHERTKELGTMRAIGFYESDVRHVLMLETLGLGIVSLIGGFILVGIINWALGFLSFSWFPSFDIFLRNGKLTALYLPATMGVNIAAVFAMLAAAVWFPAFRFSRSPLPLALSGNQ